MFDKGVIFGFVNHVDQAVESSSSDYGVAIEDAVGRDVADRPDRLLEDTGVV